MNGINHKMPLKSVNQFVSYSLKRDAERMLFNTLVAESLGTLEAGMKTRERRSYTEMWKKIWEDNSVKANDKRSAKEIISQTLKKHNIKIVEEEAK